MHHIPKPQDQARIVKSELRAMNLVIPHQDALELVAKVMGFKDWKTMSGSALELALPTAPNLQMPTRTAIPLIGPEDGDIYEGLVTVDMTLSARIQVRAYDKEEAQRLLREAGHAQYPTAFEVDDGNYRGPSDFYLGDSDAV